MRRSRRRATGWGAVRALMIAVCGGSLYAEPVSVSLRCDVCSASPDDGGTARRGFVRQGSPGGSSELPNGHEMNFTELGRVDSYGRRVTIQRRSGDRDHLDTSSLAYSRNCVTQLRRPRKAADAECEIGTKAPLSPACAKSNKDTRLDSTTPTATKPRRAVDPPLGPLVSSLFR